LLASPCTEEVKLLRPVLAPDPPLKAPIRSFTSLPRSRLCAKLTDAEGLVSRDESCRLASHTCSWSLKALCVIGILARKSSDMVEGMELEGEGRTELEQYK
jgi:hypothetical protein